MLRTLYLSICISLAFPYNCLKISTCLLLEVIRSALWDPFKLEFKSIGSLPELVLIRGRAGNGSTGCEEDWVRRASSVMMESTSAVSDDNSRNG